MWFRIFLEEKKKIPKHLIGRGGCRLGNRVFELRRLGAPRFPQEVGHKKKKTPIRKRRLDGEVDPNPYI